MPDRAMRSRQRLSRKNRERESHEGQFERINRSDRQNWTSSGLVLRVVGRRYLMQRACLLDAWIEVSAPALCEALVLAGDDVPMARVWSVRSNISSRRSGTGSLVRLRQSSHDSASRGSFCDPQPFNALGADLQPDLTISTPSRRWRARTARSPNAGSMVLLAKPSMRRRAASVQTAIEHDTAEPARRIEAHRTGCRFCSCLFEKGRHR